MERFPATWIIPAIASTRSPLPLVPEYTVEGFTTLISLVSEYTAWGLNLLLVIEHTAGCPRPKPFPVTEHTGTLSLMLIPQRL